MFGLPACTRGHSPELGPPFDSRTCRLYLDPRAERVAGPYSLAGPGRRSGCDGRVTDAATAAGVFELGYGATAVAGAGHARRVVVDANRLWRRLGELAEIGRVEGGGVTRLSFTDEERVARDLVASYMQEAGLEVREDAAGNVIGRREGRNPDAPVVLAGSHVDSVRSGGDFDGPLGVLAAVEAAQTMRDEGVETERAVEVVAFTDEEGVRFGLGMIGSRAFAGFLIPDDLSREDENGVTVVEAMREAGLVPERLGEAARGPDSVHA
jgi:Iap family predicted aminopeptidase